MNKRKWLIAAMHVLTFTVLYGALLLADHFPHISALIGFLGGVFFAITRLANS